MRLSDFIQQHRRTIVEEDLRDHAVEVLDAIVSDMKSSQSSHQQTQKSKGRDRGGALSGVGKKHGIHRLESGLKLDQMVSEYRALRASVLRLWEEEEDDKEREMTRFNEAIDETLAESAVWYTDKMAKTREQFLDVLGHDLRDPLNSIVVGATILTKSEAFDVKHVAPV